MKSINFSFYKDMYQINIFTLEDIKPAVYVGLITKEEYKEICGQDF